MTLKDWKLVGRKLGMQHDITEYYNEKLKSFIRTRKGWSDVGISVNGRHLPDKIFKTESAKIRFMKSYMRSH